MEIFAIIVLAGVCLWLGWKLSRLEKGIRVILDALHAESLPDRYTLHPAAREGSLAQVSRAVFDSLDEAKLQKSLANSRREILDFVMNQIEDALFITDAQQIIKYTNHAAQKFFSDGEISLGSQLIEECLDHRIADHAAGVLETGFRKQKIITQTNPPKSFIVDAGPIDSNHPLGPGIWILIRDITDEVQTEQIRKDFVANASHELRTPLSIIKGHLEMLEEEIDSKTFQVLQKHTERITKIVDDMLTISKLENNDPEDRMLNKMDFDFGECINGIVEQLQPLIAEHNTVLSIGLPKKKLRKFYGDRFYFDQIFFNLIENALKQNPKPGIKIEVNISREKQTDAFVIEVIDNGVGIPNAALKDIFKRFYRVEAHHSQAIKGTGLGLSIVKRAVEAHHGLVTVESQAGKRTCFRIILPLQLTEEG